MRKTLNAIACIAALLLAPLAASAATVVFDGDSVSIAYGDEFIGDVGTTGGAGTFTVTFTSGTDLLAGALATIGGVVDNAFTDLTMSWLDGSNNVVASVAVDPFVTVLATEFTSPSDLVRSLRFSWTDSGPTGAGFDFQVVAAVPVPAAGGLLLLGLGGLAIARRRNKAA